jgi:hypothetical protein
LSEANAKKKMSKMSDPMGSEADADFSVGKMLTSAADQYSWT